MSVGLTSTTASSGTNGGAGASLYDFTSFTVSGTNPAIVLVCGMDDTFDFSSVSCPLGTLTWGTPIQAINSAASGGFGRVWIYALPAPSGSGTLRVSFTGSTAFQLHAFLLAGAHQTTPVLTGAGNSESLTGTGLTKAITLANVVAGEASVGVGANVSAGDNPHFTGTAETYYDNGTAVNMAAGWKQGVGQVSVTWGTPDTDRKVFAAARIVAAAAAGGSVGPLIDGMLTEPHLIKGRLAL